MPAGNDARRPAPDAAQSPTFTVEQFGWGAPDRLVVSGTFSGLEAAPPADAVLTVFGEDGAHRLPAIDEDGARPVDGDRLTASFAWLDTPVAFHHARLELGDSLAVDLLDPETAAEGDPLPVVLLGAPDVDAPSAPEAEAPPAEADAEVEAEAEPEVEAEAPRRPADLEGAADRFREGLAMVRRSAEEALAAAADARAEAEEQARTEIAGLRERVAQLELASAERDAARAELESVSAERDAARAELTSAHEDLDAARAALHAARERAQELLDGLSEPAPGRR